VQEFEFIYMAPTNDKNHNINLSFKANSTNNKKKTMEINNYETSKR